MTRFRITAFAAAALATAVFPTLGRAEGTLRVAVDKAQVVTVNGTAGIVLVANPAIADVVVERNHLVFVVGKRPGETRLYIYSNNGTPLLERDVIVVPQGDRAVTVIRDTRATNYSCDPQCVPVSGAPERAPGAAGG